MDEIAIKVENVSKVFRLPHEKSTTLKSLFTNLFKGKKNRSYERQYALKNISFEIKKGEFFGIVGRNGSGKSTLLKMLAGIYQPTNGRIHVKGKLVPFIELGVGFNPELTGRENVYLNGALLGFSEQQVRDMYDEIVEFAELEKFMDQKLKNYSSGMQVRLAFSMAIRAKADILLVDEVLAVGDADFQRKCFEYFRRLKKMETTVVFVTHDMNAVVEYCDRALLIEDSEITDIGSPKMIAGDYQKMFLENAVENKNQSQQDSKRWGNFSAKYSDVTAKVENDQLIIKAKIKPDFSLEDVYFGIHVVGDDGVEVTATNNRMIGEPDMKNLKPGDIINIEWQILNIFNDGSYFITLTMVDDSVGILDWFENASSFTVKRAQRSTTHVFPPTTLKVSEVK